MDWIQIAGQFGVPVVELAALAYGIFQLYNDLIKPTVLKVTERHLSFIDRVEAAMTTCSEVNHIHAHANQQNAEAIQSIADAMTKP